MKGKLVGGGVVVFVALALGCAPKVVEPPPAAAPKPAPVSAVQDDRVDLAQLHDIVEDWHRAWKTENRALEVQVDARLKRWIQQELAEDQRQVQQSRQEATNSSQTGSAHAAADDRKDASKQAQEAANTRELATSLNTLQIRFDQGNAAPAQYQRKSELLRQLQQVARRELERSRSEAAEDRNQGGGGGQASAQPAPKPKPKPAVSSGGSGGGQKAAPDDDDGPDVVGPKKLVAAIDAWTTGRTEQKPKQVANADREIRTWWQQELARDKPWTPRSKQIALELKKTQPAFNKGEATAAQYKAKRELLLELKKIAQARMK